MQGMRRNSGKPITVNAVMGSTRKAQWTRLIVQAPLMNFSQHDLAKPARTVNQPFVA